MTRMHTAAGPYDATEATRFAAPGVPLAGAHVLEDSRNRARAASSMDDRGV